MASKKFAHWNGFPFMTAPRTKYYSGQTQSPLFRLSREIRDIIYGYYTLGEGDNGYHYDSETGKMLERSPSSEPKRIVRLGLMISCRIAAEELKDCAFRKLQFSPHLSQNDGKAFLGLASRAGRFQCLLRYADRQKRRMLIQVSELLQHEDWLDLHDRFPSVQGWLRQRLGHSVAAQEDDLEWTEDTREGLASLLFSDALQHVLILAKNRNPPRFARLACTVFGTGRCPLDGGIASCHSNNLFVEGALYDIFSWHPDSWSLPSDDELSKLEALICMPGDADHQLAITEDGTYYFSDVADHVQASNLYRSWCFSAASIAIDFLHKLPRQQRDNIHTIILNETKTAASRPEHHPRGLIPFCRENPKLQIERHITVSASQCPIAGLGNVWDMSDCFRETMLWIEAALELSTLGMPAQSFTLVINVGPDFWQVFKHAAALQEATYELLRRIGHPVPPSPNGPRYDCVWNFPDNFLKIVRDITEGSSCVRLQGGDVGDIWDSDVFFNERMNWTDEQWGTDSFNATHPSSSLNILPVIHKSRRWDMQWSTVTKRFVGTVEGISPVALSEEDQSAGSTIA